MHEMTLVKHLMPALAHRATSVSVSIVDAVSVLPHILVAHLCFHL